MGLCSVSSEPPLFTHVLLEIVKTHTNVMTPDGPWSRADPEGGGGAGGPDPLENHKLYGFL